MHDANPLSVWGNFYVIVGSSSGALIGLQFVVMTLIAENGASGTRRDAVSAFGTPTVVHFGAALLVSAIASVPWGALGSASIAFTLSGLLGLTYAIVVVRRQHRQSDYEPVFEDWLWHTMLPIAAYVGLLAGGLVLSRTTSGSLLTIGASALLLVVIGIHNAWD